MTVEGGCQIQRRRRRRNFMSTVAELHCLSPCGTDVSGATDILTTGDQRSSDTQSETGNEHHPEAVLYILLTTVLLLVLVVCLPLSWSLHFDAADIWFFYIFSYRHSFWIVFATRLTVQYTIYPVDSASDVIYLYSCTSPPLIRLKLKASWLSLTSLICC